MSDAEDEIVLPKPSPSKVLERQQEERKELRKKIERIRSSIPKKDRTGRARAAEEAAEEEKKLIDQQLLERQDYGIDEATISTLMSEVNIEGSTAENSTNVERKGESKAARRRRKKAEQEAEAKKRIEDEKANMGPSPKYIEMQAIEEQLRPKNLMVHPIPADGHCLYNAVAHQMTTCQIASSIPTSVAGLRNATADYLLKHEEEYIPFVEEIDGDRAAFKRYCERLRTTAVWGGQVELKALADILDAGIEVYAANMPIVQMGKCDGTSSVLRVSFHREYYSLGEHYNSVIPTQSVM